MLQRIIRSVIFIGLFLFLIIRDDYFDLFVYHTTPMNLSWSYMTARFLTAMLLYIPFTDWINHQNKFYVIALRYGTALFLVGWLLFSFPYTDPFFYKGKIIITGWLAIPIASVIILMFAKVSKLNFEPKTFFSMIGLIVSTALPQILSPPDLLPGSSHSNTINQAVSLSKDSLYIVDFEAPNQLVAFYAVNCPYCKMAAQKIDDWARKNAIPYDSVKTVLGGKYTNPEKYFDYLQLTKLETQDLNPEIFNAITGGRVPLILHLQYGKVVGSYRFRDFHDLAILQTWKQEQIH